MFMQWKEGDVVRLKSGGPRMIIDRVMHYSDDSTSVYCVWFDGGQKENVAFHQMDSSSARTWPWPASEYLAAASL